MPGSDPAHIQAGGDWRRIAAKLRDGRVQVADQAAPEQAAPQRAAQVKQASKKRTKVARAGS
jgi:hypothetical protein